jgi:predicted O-methyltransferase YrrM
MSKLAILKTFFAHPKEILTLGYAAMVRKNKTVNYEQNVRNKYGISQLPTIDLLELFPDLSERIDNYTYLAGTSMVTDIVLLKSLARCFPECSYMEIGSFRGESIGAVADVAKECLSVTLSKEEMLSMGANENHIASLGILIKNKPNITTKYHNSLTLDFSTLGKKFDLMFVDGDHTYNAVKSDTQNVFKLLKDENSIIVWHDYAYDQETVRHEVMSAILDGTPEQYRGNLYHVSNSMCAIFIKGKFNTTYVQSEGLPNKVFSVSIEARKFS